MQQDRQLYVGRKFRMVAIDLDGTLLNNFHQLSDINIKILRKLSAKGVLISIATGRGLDTTFERYLQQLSLPQSFIPVVVYNGAIAAEYTLNTDTQTLHKRILHSNPVPKKDTIRLINFAAERGLLLQYYDSSKGEVIISPKKEEHLELSGKYEKLTGKAQKKVESYEEIIDETDSSKVLILTKEIDKYLKEAQQVFGNGDFNIIKGSEYFMEFLNPDTSKGDTLKKLCQHLNISMDEVVSFGDGDNDKEMLELSGLGFAMTNAKDDGKAKAVADAITTWTNHEDGVGKTLDALEQAGCFDLNMLE